MLSVKWKKALRDLTIHKTRTVLVILAIAVGVFGCGFIMDSYTILLREMDRNYLDTHPASFILEARSGDDRLERAIRQYPGVMDAEPRLKVVGRIRTGSSEWRTIWLYVIDDFRNVRIDRFKPEDGNYPPERGEILLERQALSVAQSTIGKPLTVKLPEQSEKVLHLAGTVHAPGLAPAWMENMAYGFINQATYRDLGGRKDIGGFRVVLATGRFNERHIRRVSHQLRQYLEDRGYMITGIEIPQPGKHPHADQMRSLLFLLQAFGGLALILSGVLVANMFSSMLAGELRQIGVMKAVGGQNRDVMAIYFNSVVILGLIALGIAMPVALVAGRIYSDFAAAMLNFKITSYTVPHWAYMIQALVGLVVPLIAAAYPIWKGSRISVKEALNSYGVKEVYQGGPASRLSAKMEGINRPLLLSIRNTFRKRGRFLLTLGTLAVGGAFFIVALNVGASIKNTVANSFKTIRYDMEIKLTKSYPATEIYDTVHNVPGVLDAEIWASSNGNIVNRDGLEGVSFKLVAPSAKTKLLRLPLISGRWLNRDERYEVVLNHILQEKLPGVKVGDPLTLQIGDQKQRWRVAGIVREIGAFPKAYIHPADLPAGATKTQNVMIRWERVQPPQPIGHMVLLNHINRNGAMGGETNPKSEASVSGMLLRKLADAGIDLIESWNTSFLRKIFEDHLQIIVGFLIIMAFLIVIVGSLGLASTMSMNILERMREIGVMRSVGASHGDIYSIVIGEAMIIGFMSWITAVLLSIPLTFWVAATFGGIFFHTPLDVAMTHLGMALWLFMVMVITALAGYFPARKAIRLPVREALNYE